MGPELMGPWIRLGKASKDDISAGLSDKEGGLLQAPGSNALRRVVINQVYPVIDGGRYPVKRVVGESIKVDADIFADGHDRISAVLEWRYEEGPWQVVRMIPLGNDRWQAGFVASAVGRYAYRLRGWVDPYLTWRAHVKSFLAAHVEISAVVWLEGISRVRDIAKEVPSRRVARALREWTDQFSEPAQVPLALNQLDALMEDIAPIPHVPSQYPDEEAGLPLWVDPMEAQYTAWYELFPRSAGSHPGLHGTFLDVIERLPYIAGLGFSVVYLPPIHPIGESFRKGRRNTTIAGPGDPGSPWAIGGAEGGHLAIHPELGRLEDFEQLVESARDFGLSIALDLAFQCSPDHPWVHQHPEWFRIRADGSIQFAENPPKKYEDIVPFDFECEAWPSLWEALYGVVEYWIAHGVRFFRVDNPHTKSLYFWEWLIDKVKRNHSDVIFLAEAFTRPAVMQHLAKVGFSQSYTYFTWRNSPSELRQYMEELVSVPEVDYFRPSFWPNTPDILPQSLQVGGKPAFVTRLILAATLSASYGIYGPVFELMEATPAVIPGEEYEDSEKYRTAQWDWGSPDSLAPLVRKVNQFRHQHPALAHNRSIRFHAVDNDQLLVYSKVSPDGADVVLMVVNMDYRYRQSGFVTLELEELGISPDDDFIVSDSLTGSRYVWHGPKNYVELDPKQLSAHLFHVEKEISTGLKRSRRI